jgi:hypothetical protein
MDPQSEWKCGEFKQYRAGWHRRGGIKARTVILLRWRRYRLGMCVAIMFNSQAESEGEQDKSNDALFLSSENEALPQCLKS